MKHSTNNYIQINGCPPNKTVPKVSFIAKGFFDILQGCRADNGTLLVPDYQQKFLSYRPNGEGSLCFQIAEPLLLDGSNPDEAQMPTKVLALTEKLKDEFNNLESEKKQLEERAKEQAERAEEEQLKLT